MKPPSILLASICAILSVNALDGKIQAGKKSLEFAGETFFLSDSRGDSVGVRNKYLPQGQTIENWTRAITIHLYYGESDVEFLMENQKSIVADSFPDAKLASQVTRNKREARLRYLVNTEKPASLAQFNIWRFIKVEDPRPQVLAYQFTTQKFTDDFDGFNRKIIENLETWTQALLQARFQLPTHKVNIDLVDNIESRGINKIKEGELYEGISLLVEATRKDPQNPIRHFNLGNILLTYAKNLYREDSVQNALLLFNEAKEYLEEAVVLFQIFSPEAEQHSQANFLLGEIEFNIHENYDLARDHYKKALTINPGNREAQAALRIFKEKPDESN